MNLRHAHLFSFCLAIGAVSLSACMGLRPPRSAAVAPGPDRYRRIDLSPDRYTPRAALKSKESQTSETLVGRRPVSEVIPSPEELPIDFPTVLQLVGSDTLEVQLAREKLAEAKARRLSADFQFLPRI